MAPIASGQRPNRVAPSDPASSSVARAGRPFAVTVGTIFEDSHIPLSKWLMGIQLLCAGRDGVVMRDLRGTLGVTYKTASFMTRRLRRAMVRVTVGAPDRCLG